MCTLEKKISELIDEGRVISGNCKPNELGPCAILPDPDDDGRFARWRRRSLGLLKSKLSGSEIYSTNFEEATKSYWDFSVNDGIVILEDVLDAYKNGFLQENMTLKQFVENVSKNGDAKSKSKLKSLLHEKAVEGIVGSSITSILGLL